MFCLLSTLISLFIFDVQKIHLLKFLIIKNLGILFLIYILILIKYYTKLLDILDKINYIIIRFLIYYILFFFIGYIINNRINQSKKEKIFIGKVIADLCSVGLSFFLLYIELIFKKYTNKLWKWEKIYLPIEIKNPKANEDNN